MLAYLKLLRGIQLPNPNVIEIGGGSGFLSGLLAQRLGWNITVLDNNPDALEFGRRLNPNPAVNFEAGDLFQCQGSYDLVFSDGLIEHWYPKERHRVIRRHADLARSGGYVVIFVPRDTWFVRSFLCMKQGFEDKFTVSQLCAEVAREGLQVVRSIQDFHMAGVLCQS